MFDRLEDTVNRYEDITAELGNPDVVNDQEKFRKLMKEQSSLAPLIETYTEYKNCKKNIEMPGEELEVGLHAYIGPSQLDYKLFNRIDSSTVTFVYAYYPYRQRLVFNK